MGFCFVLATLDHYPIFISLTLSHISYCSILPIYLSRNFKVQYYIIITYIMLFLVNLDHAINLLYCKLLTHEVN